MNVALLRRKVISSILLFLLPAKPEENGNGRRSCESSSGTLPAVSLDNCVDLPYGYSNDRIMGLLGPNGLNVTDFFTYQIHRDKSHKNAMIRKGISVIFSSTGGL